MSVPDRSTFESIYAGQPPWDIGRPQKAFLDVADKITGSILDAGCGTGENALYFAGRGCKVTGIDFLEDPITRAKQKAADRGVLATFQVMDALMLNDWLEEFDNVIDSGLFHVFNDGDRRCYVEGLEAILKPDGRLFMLCFSDEEPGTQGPRRVSKKELHDAFVGAWHIESIKPFRFEVRPDLKDFTFSEGGPKAWFVVVRRAMWCGRWSMAVHDKAETGLRTGNQRRWPADWPRGVSKQMAKIDLWLKDLSPSTELRMLGFISSSFASSHPLEWRTSLHESDHLG
jgi:SAM-dependent methyltransferase